MRRFVSNRRIDLLQAHRFVLGVISDGPTKSFAWRRLRYLESKWNMYVLLNEYQELADMKVRRLNDLFDQADVDAQRIPHR